jgi:hypothetical protein
LTGIALKLMGATLDQAGAETAALKRLDRRTVRLLPCRLELRTRSARHHAPGQLDGAAGRRQRAVFGRIGSELVQHHAKRKRLLRHELDKAGLACACPRAFAPMPE